MISVECRNIKQVTDRGNLRAFADVDFYLSGKWFQLMRAVRVVQQEGQKAWVSMPAQKGRDGRWHTITSFSDDIKNDIKAVVLAAYAKLA